MDKYLSSLASSPVRTLQEIVDFNKTYQHLELPPGIIVSHRASQLPLPLSITQYTHLTIPNPPPQQA